jgi:hypothetical protein
MIYYKLRLKEDPTKFVTGTPRWYSYKTTGGRVFHTMGQLRSFLTSAMNYDDDYNKVSNDKRNSLSKWEVVELEVTEKSVKGIHEVITAKKLVELLTK